MGFAQGILSRGRTAFWTAVALIAGPPFLLLVILIAGLVSDTRIEVDAALVFLAIAAVILATGLVHLVRHMTRPKEVVHVGYTMKLEQPAVPMGRYAFRLQVHYELRLRGERHVTQQAAIEMRFKRADHPELMRWCSEQVARHLDQHREVAQELYPEARVVVSPPPRTAALQQPERATTD